MCFVYRWAEENKLPYKDVPSLLPDEMQFFIADWAMFGKVRICTDEGILILKLKGVFGTFLCASYGTDV